MVVSCHDYHVWQRSWFLLSIASKITDRFEYTISKLAIAFASGTCGGGGAGQPINGAGSHQKGNLMSRFLCVLSAERRLALAELILTAE